MTTALRTLFVALVLVAVGTPVAHSGDDSKHSSKAKHVERKRQHFLTVVEELSKRDVSHLDEAQRKRRRTALAELRAYALKGKFPVDERYTGFGVPYLIDDHGTRCALAHLIDHSGAARIIDRLALTHNHAFVPGLAHDRELVAWLRDHGLAVEEAAFIQMPPFTDGDTDITDTPLPDPVFADPSMPDIPRTAPTPSTQRPGDSDMGRRPRTSGAKAPTWHSWWDLNRSAFVDLRTRYHDEAVVTPSEDDTSAAGHRPSTSEVGHVLSPLFRKLAKEGKTIGGTALMAWARLGIEADAEEITGHALRYVGQSGNQYRGLMLLAVGLTKTPAGTAALSQIVRDTPAGRKHLAAKGTLPERTRAFAAIALGLTENDAAIDVLLDVLKNEKGDKSDLRACCIAALGHATSNGTAMRRTQVRAKLVEGVSKRTWSDSVLAAAPFALLHMGDAAGLRALHDEMGRFRKPQALRQSMALALGAHAKGAPGRETELLLATAQRDPDPLARRYAIVSLGQRTPDADMMTREAIEARRITGRFYLSALQGHQVQKADRPWVYLGAALYAQKDAPQAKHVSAALVKAALGGGNREARAAAVVALGLLGGPAPRGTLRELFKKTRDQALRPYVAEAMGLLRDRESRGILLTLVKKDGTPEVRYRAALGLGYLADRSLVDELVGALQSARSEPVRAALTRVIGEIGDRSAISTLVKIASDVNQDDMTRGRAIAALGLIGETANPTWTERFKLGANRGAATPTLKAVLSIF